MFPRVEIHRRGSQKVMRAHFSTAAGDPLAGDLLAHSDFLRRIARALVRDEDVAEDMVQEALLAAVARRPQAPQGIRAWLYGALRRSVLMHFRTEQRRLAREGLLARDSGGADSVSDVDSEQVLLNVERTSVIGQAVAALREPYRTVVTLRYYEDLKPREIARHLDRSVHTVNTQLQRGLAKLRVELDEKSGGDRERWVGALLPFALQGPGGWWPVGVHGALGLSNGAIAAWAALLAVCSVLAWTWAGDAGADAPEGRRSAAPIERRGSTDTVAELEMRQERSAAPASTAQADPVDAAAGELVLTVVLDSAPVSGALVKARRESLDDVAHSRISTVIEGSGGVDIKVVAEGIRIPTTDERRRRVESFDGTTDGEGRVLLPVLDGGVWTMEVDADGCASRRFEFRDQGARGRCTISLAPACPVVVARGDLPLEHNVLMQLENSVGGVRREAILEAGMQTVEFDVEPGEFTFEALSSEGDSVAQWNLTRLARPGEVTDVDLSLGGTTRLQLNVRGADLSVPGLYATVESLPGRDDKPEWTQTAPVHGGIAQFAGLPRGQAVVRVLCRGSEVGSAPIQLRAGVDSHEVDVRVGSGRLTVLHEGVRGEGLRMWLARRTPSGIDGWWEAEAAIPGAAASHFEGLVPGDYHLAVFGGGVFRTWTLRHGGDARVVDLGERGDERAALRLQRGTGIAPSAPLEIEIRPGRWAPVGRITDMDLELLPGEYRFRMGLSGVGYSTKTAHVPEERVVSFAEDTAPSTVAVECEDCGSYERLRLIATDPRVRRHGRRALLLHLDGRGHGTAELRPGNYEAIDRWGRRSAFSVARGQRTVAIGLDGVPGADR